MNIIHKGKNELFVALFLTGNSPKLLYTNGVELLVTIAATPRATCCTFGVLDSKGTMNKV